MDLLLPNERLNGEVVVASSYITDDSCVYLTLRAQPHYYAITLMIGGYMFNTVYFANIVDAVAAYKEITQ